MTQWPILWHSHTPNCFYTVVGLPPQKTTQTQFMSQLKIFMLASWWLHLVIRDARCWHFIWGTEVESPVSLQPLSQHHLFVLLLLWPRTLSMSGKCSTLSSTPATLRTTRHRHLMLWGTRIPNVSFLVPHDTYYYYILCAVALDLT